MRFIKSIIFTLIYTVIYLILQAIVQIVMMVGWGYSFAIENLTLSVLFTSIIAFFFYWGIIKLRKQKLATSCNFKKFDFRQILLLLLLGFFIQYMLQGIIIIYRMEEKFPEHTRTIKRIFESGSPLMVVLTVVISAPFIEEIIFRGLIINELKNKMSNVIAIIIQAVIFGLIHGNWLQVAYATFIGIILGVIVVWSGSVWSTVIVHISMNGSPLLMSIFWDINQTDAFISRYKILVTIICGILVVASMYFIYKINHTVSKVSAAEIPDSGAI